MKTQILIEADLTDEQLEALVQEIKETASMIGVSLKVETKESANELFRLCNCFGECKKLNSSVIKCKLKS